MKAKILTMTFEDEDFDLDADLKPASDREYVSLNKNGEEESETAE